MAKRRPGRMPERFSAVYQRFYSCSERALLKWMRAAVRPANPASGLFARLPYIISEKGVVEKFCLRLLVYQKTRWYNILYHRAASFHFSV
ncbi:hypothetical protein A5N82_04420 [Christensenella minuta]|uniref:Uncharacterized protein n=1 Tax=Christensenella minuta TaxID=626937 RepID=A0A136Q4A7_9FIRM|nr:hypothetical protein B1H56_11260 [Christensenella minuta]KXK65487.1 hypothetical protein HMPREF3293_01701 [Christensenella minuta]OAQ42613.1 hypothetical protein A5N82_04420 [Christensenella minuta]